MSYSPRDQVLLDYSSLGPGDTVSGEMCPKCSGGGGREGSLSAGRTEDGLLWWRCHRASCSWRGSSQEGLQRAPSLPATTPLGTLQYELEGPIPGDLESYLEDTLHLSSYAQYNAGWRWTSSYGGRVVMPIFDHNRHTVGHNLRSYVPGVKKKSLINRLADGELISWYSNSKYSQTIIVVEDQPSAVRVSSVPGWTGLALLGTNFSPERARLVKASKARYPVLALDADATASAVSQTIKLRSILPNLRVVALSKDLKNQSPEEFELFVHEVNTLTRN